MTTGTETRRPLLTPASLVTITRQTELYEARIPLGTISLVGGFAGEGKSSWLIHVTALATRGLLDGDLKGTPVTALWVNIEDDPGRVQVPRLTAAGADLDKVFFLGMSSTVDEVTRETTPTLPLDIDAFREALIESGARLLVLDPASSLMSGDLNKREDARRSLDALSTLAQEMDVAIVLVLHLAKGRGRASEKISGSHALRDAVRSVILIARDDETDQRIITINKANYGPHTGRSWAFEMVDAEVRSVDGETLHIGRVVDLGETDITVDSIINREQASDDAEEDRNDSERWLIGYLEDHGGSAPAGDIRKAAIADGFEWRTMQRWSRKVTSKRKTGFQGAWVWELDLTKGAPKDSKDDSAQSADAFGTYGTGAHP